MTNIFHFFSLFIQHKLLCKFILMEMWKVNKLAMFVTSAASYVWDCDQSNPTTLSSIHSIWEKLRDEIFTMSRFLPSYDQSLPLVKSENWPFSRSAKMDIISWDIFIKFIKFNYSWLTLGLPKWQKLPVEIYFVP